MRHHATIRGLLLAGLMLTTAGVCSAQGYSRVQRAITSPGAGLGRGVSGRSLYGFRQSSYGTGQLSRQAYNDTRGILRANIGINSYRTREFRGTSLQQQNEYSSLAERTPNYSITRRIGSGSSLSTSLQNTLPDARKTTGREFLTASGDELRQIYAPQDPARKAGLEVLKTEAPSTLAAMSAANYFTAVDSQQSSLLQQGEEDITTLVPEEPGSYQDKMRLGERLFRQGEYREASREFELANVISLNAPETHLSLMHVHFAGADRNYSLPAYYLRQALRYLPELPLVRVHPKSFYGQTATYIRDLVDLEDYVKADPFDYDSRLMLAYLQWRDGQTTESVENLSYALALAVNEEQIEAVDTLWDGMTASGKTSGVLAPAELPQPESEEESADPTANPSPDEADEIPAPAPSEGE